MNSQVATAVQTATLIVILATAIAVAAALAFNRLERTTTKALSHWFGWRSVMITGWLGVPAHELSHLATCKLLGLRVVDYRLFAPDPRSSTLGYVHYVQEGRGIGRAIRRFLVGTAPLAAGVAVLTVGWFVIFPRTLAQLPAPPVRGGPMVGSMSLSGLRSALTALRSLPILEKASHPLFWIYSYLALAVGLHMAPSRADLKNAVAGGLITTAGLIAILAGLTSLWPRATSMAGRLVVMAFAALLWTFVVTWLYSLAIRGLTWMVSRR